MGKTIFLTNTLTAWAGEPNRVLCEARAARACGHEPVLVAPPAADLQRRARDEGFRTATLAFPSNPFSRLRESRALAMMLQRTAGERPPLLHTHDSRDAWYGYLARKLFRQKFHFIRSRHNEKPVGDNPWNRSLHRNIDRLVVISEAVRAQFAHFESAGIVPPDKVRVIPSACEERFFNRDARVRETRRKQHGFALADVVLLFVGRVRLNKGILHLCEVLPEIFQRYPETKLLLVGEVTQAEVGAALAKLRRDFAPRLVVTGQVADSHPEYLAADVFVLPSFLEGLGTACLEALATGKVIVCSDAGGLKELIPDDSVGYTFPARSREGLRAALLECLAERERWPALQQAAARRSEQFSEAALRERLARLWAEFP